MSTPGSDITDFKILLLLLLLLSLSLSIFKDWRTVAKAKIFVFQERSYLWQLCWGF